MADKELMNNATQERLQIRPLYKIQEIEGKVVISIEMPGVKKEDLKINIENSELRVYGGREQIVEGGAYLVRERRAGDFVQVFTLDDTVDPNKVDATLERGMLTVELHLKEEVKPRLIQIKSS
jgi:HSP20 family protein